MSELVKDWVNPYARSVERQALDPSAPTMEGPLYVRRKDQITQPTEVVPKEYVDQFTVAPMANIWQPYTVGRYYCGNYATGTSPGAWSRLGEGRLSLMYLDQSYNVDQVAVHCTATGSQGRATIAIYRCDQNTMLPSSLLDGLGGLSLVVGLNTITLDPVKAYSGLIGLYMQVTANVDDLNFQVDAQLDRHGQSLFGHPDMTNSTPTDRYAYRLRATNGLVNGVLPAPALFKYEHLQQLGSGVFLRRAA